METNKIYNCDCIQGMGLLDDCSIDLTVTSPPYDTLKNYGGTLTEDVWNYKVFKNVVSELYRVTKPGGVVVWVIGDQTKNGSETCTSFKQALEFVNCGFNLNDTMIWYKTNSMPQVRQPRYNQTFEYMFVFSKGKPKTFNPIMVPCKCAGQKYDSTTKNIREGDGRTHKTFNINKEKVDDNIWNIAVAQNKTSHPAVFPLEIPKRHISSWSNEGDVVLDPFMGSGTTAIACVRENRQYIGFEINEEYCSIANNRISNELTNNKQLALEI